MQKSHVAYNQRKYAPAVCARRSPACMRGIVSHRSTACMRDGLVCTKPAGFFGFYLRRACMRSRLLSATLRYINTKAELLSAKFHTSSGSVKLSHFDHCIVSVQKQ